MILVITATLSLKLYGENRTTMLVISIRTIIVTTLSGIWDHSSGADHHYYDCYNYIRNMEP